MRRNRLWTTALVACLVLCLNTNTHAADRSDIRLILQITVDGLRADLVNRYADRFGDGGFRYLLDEGVVYTNAHYQHANTETIVGHTTLATGASPSQHGMIGNVWYDRASGELAYNIEDPDSPLLPVREDATTGDQVDPAQQLARTSGRSPVAILAPTLADTLAAYYGGKSRLFGVGGKDRSAVSMAGHAGKAFWYSTDTGDFVTSRYYYEAYPQWVARWNSQRKAQGHAGTSWELLHPRDTYLLAHQDDRPYEADLKGYGRVFPHPYGESGDKLLYTRLLASPVGDQLTVDFAKALITNERLGRDETPDYLSVSLSSTDAVNHFFGPSSLENEDVVLRLDRLLADLFAYVDDEVGPGRTLVVLSADHGMADMPEYLSGLGFEVGRLDDVKLIGAANRAGKRLFGIKGIVRLFFRPYLYLDEEKIAGAGLEFEPVMESVANALRQEEGIALAVPRTGLSDMRAAPAVERVKRNFHPDRSGDIYIVQKPYWFLFSKGPVVAMHGTPWRYDTHVPIMFAGPGISPRQENRLVHPVDVAPTIAAVLGMSGPGAATGSVLEEVVGQQVID